MKILKRIVLKNIGKWAEENEILENILIFIQKIEFW